MINLVCGIPGAGKTTLCSTKTSISFDGWAMEHYDTWNANEAGDLFLQDEKGMDIFLDAVASMHSEHGDIMLEYMAVSKEQRTDIIHGLRLRGVKDISCTYVLCDLCTALHRNMERESPVYRGILFKAWSIQEFPTVSEGFLSVDFKVGA